MASTASLPKWCPPFRAMSRVHPLGALHQVARLSQSADWETKLSHVKMLEVDVEELFIAVWMINRKWLHEAVTLRKAVLSAGSNLAATTLLLSEGLLFLAAASGRGIKSTFMAKQWNIGGIWVSGKPKASIDGHAKPRMQRLYWFPGSRFLVY